jgi:hypothetical protein
MIEYFMPKSKCNLSRKEKEFLVKLLGNKYLVTDLLYRGSDHGWKAIDFHSRCDKKGPTLCLFKIEEGDWIGGYTSS